MIKYSLITLLFSLLLGVYSPGMAEDVIVEGDASGPFIPKAQRRFIEAQGCVEPTGEMRVNHMEYILDQRDATCARRHSYQATQSGRMYQLPRQRR